MGSLETLETLKPQLLTNPSIACAQSGLGGRYADQGSVSRLGMHLLFYGGTQIKLLHNRSVESVLRDLSVRVRACEGSVEANSDADVSL